MIKVIYNLIESDCKKQLFTMGYNSHYCPVPAKGDCIMLGGITYQVEKITLDYGTGDSSCFTVYIIDLSPLDK